VKHSIIEQLAVYGLDVELCYSGEGRYDGNYRLIALASQVHTWRVRITSRRTENAVLEDSFSATALEHRQMRRDTVALAEKYLLTLMGRIERVRNLEARTFTQWCKAMGVRTADLNGPSGNQWHWRQNFEQDCRAAREFAELLGGDDKVDEFLSTTTR
jgi:hypothetical protein